MAALLSSCAKDDPLAKYQNMPAEAIFATGHTALQNDNYHEAAQALQALNAEYPYTPYSEQANLDLIYANYMIGEPAMALALAQRFLKLYPSSADAAYAYYMTGVINFNNGRGFMQRYLPYDMADHDAQSYQEAFQNFKTVVTRYPDSAYSQDARVRMIYLRNVMAQFQLNTAEFYLKDQAYLAAIDRAKTVLIHFPHSPQVKGAMEVLIKAYKDLNLPTLANNMQKVYDLNYGTK